MPDIRLEVLRDHASSVLTEAVLIGFRQTVATACGVELGEVSLFAAIPAAVSNVPPISLYIFAGTVEESELEQRKQAICREIDLLKRDRVIPSLKISVVLTKVKWVYGTA